MDPNKTTQQPAVTSLADEDWAASDGLDELELELLLGRDIDVDEPEDWRAVDF
jgi:hypothetical protein